jgi:hypothetical protein
MVQPDPDLMPSAFDNPTWYSQWFAKAIARTCSGLDDVGRHMQQAGVCVA